MEEKVVRYIRELVGIKSISGEEEALAHRIKEILDMEGVDRAFIDRYGNVIGVLEGGVDETIVYEGHMDHVPEGDLSNWETTPYEAKIIDSNVYGRATVDMKGAIASMLSSISLLRGRDLPNIYFIFVSQEEHAEGVLLKYALEDTLDIRPDMVILGEATNLNISVGQRGRAVIHIRVYGETSHASMPEKGMNALAASTYVMDKVFRINKKLPSHRLLGRSTITPTIIECSPKSPPMVPDRCFINLDRRFIVGESEEEIMNPIKKIAEDAVKMKLANHIETYIPEEELMLWNNRVIKAKYFFPAWITDRNAIVKRIFKLIRRNVDRESKYVTWRFSTDGVYSAGVAGIPTIGFGPGDERLAHKPNENVPIKHLIKAVEGYTYISRAYPRK